MSSEQQRERSGVIFSDGVEPGRPSADQLTKWTDEFEAWAGRVARKRPEGHEAVIHFDQPLNWSALKKPLSKSTVALVSTGGVHLQSQEPFDVFALGGDPSLREIGGDVRSEDLTVTHTHYATDDAKSDINVMFAIDRLRELSDEGVVGAVSPVHYGLMGFAPDPALLVEETAVRVAEDLGAQGVDIVVLTPG